MSPAIALDLPANELPCPREVRIWIDQLLVAIEALDLQAVEAMIEMTKQHHLQDLVPNRVGLWRLRNTNPLRRNYQRRELSWLELKSLVCLTCAMASQMNTICGYWSRPSSRCRNKNRSLRTDSKPKL
ncbi:MAG: DUF3038 domain-containing protein, partial [Oscillatoriales cyanobacterium SM2_2_1]|nr:DUF3038 domain-containing protein [Oscillatoriales cyanobacterium SM2_2_1]